MESKRDFFIEEAKKVHGDKYDYSKVVYKRAHDKMCIICPKHGEFWQDKFAHLGSGGCPKCSREALTAKQTFSQEEFIKRCKEIWGDRYSYEHAIYKGILKKVMITCPVHGDFEITPNSFLRKQGCAKCAGTKKLTTEEFINRAREIHGDKYDYSKVEYVNNQTKVCIICPEHGEFWQQPSNHLAGNRCPKCFRSYKKTVEQFIAEAREVHGDKYDYSQVDYHSNKSPITVVCPKHGAWTIKPLAHLQGQGCKKCYHERQSERKRSTTEEFIEKARKIHGNTYDYSKVEYLGSKEDVCIICREKNENGIEHGEFWQSPNKHLARQGCPKCKRSRLEERVENILIANDIKYEPQKRFSWLGFQLIDFYLSDYNIAIECQGEQHFSNVKIFGGDKGFKYRLTLDIKKNQHCIDHGVEVLYVIDDDFLSDNKEIIYGGIYNTENVIAVSDIENWLSKIKTKVIS